MDCRGSVDRPPLSSLSGSGNGPFPEAHSTPSLVFPGRETAKRSLAPRLGDPPALTPEKLFVLRPLPWNRRACDLVRAPGVSVPDRARVRKAVLGVCHAHNDGVDLARICSLNTHVTTTGARIHPFAAEARANSATRVGRARAPGSPRSLLSGALRKAPSYADISNTSAGDLSKTFRSGMRVLARRPERPIGHPHRRRLVDGRKATTRRMGIRDPIHRSGVFFPYPTSWPRGPAQAPSSTRFSDAPEACSALYINQLLSKKIWP